MKILSCYKVMPGKKATKMKTAPTIQSIEKAIGGNAEFIKVKLRNEKQVSIVFDSDRSI